MFRSLQGESTRSGQPCVFIRLAGCNLNCRWCDTRYAVTEQGESRPVAEVLKIIRGYDTDLVCVTGGEPLLQRNTPSLVAALIHEGYITQVETNGSRDISVLPEDASRIMDVKCPGSGEKGTTLEDNFAELNGGDEVKFVIADRDDFDWACRVVADRDLCGKCPVLFSPVSNRAGTDDPALSGRRLAEWILDTGSPIRLQLQLHRLLWPHAERGR
ncbi:MAG: 7-carboxy-7-deazaguanine synthase QueE [Planctomycetota bacterium]